MKELLQRSPLASVNYFVYINQSIYVIIIQSCTFNKPLHFQPLFNYSTKVILRHCKSKLFHQSCWNNRLPEVLLPSCEWFQHFLTIPKHTDHTQQHWRGPALQTHWKTENKNTQFSLRITCCRDLELSCIPCHPQAVLKSCASYGLKLQKCQNECTE